MNKIILLTFLKFLALVLPSQAFPFRLNAIALPNINLTLFYQGWGGGGIPPPMYVIQDKRQTTNIDTKSY